MKPILRPRQILLISFFTLCSLLLTWLSGLAVSPYAHPLRQATIQPPSPSPTYDPLAIPTLPAHPTQFDLGKSLYYYHCMPCHGDLGQGLTDDFRKVWEEDHQNCWGRGCHGGRQEDEGFPIPTFIPGIISDQDSLSRYRKFEDLRGYLHDTHPPQYPGRLAEDEYQALTAYLWEANQKPVREIVPIAPQSASLTSTLVSTPTADADPIVILQTSIPATKAGMNSSSVNPSERASSNAVPDRSFFLAAGGLLLFLFLLVARGLLRRRS